MSPAVVLAVNFNHDGAAALLVGGRLAGFVCTERFSRRKKHPGLREPDLDVLLDQAGLGTADVDHVLLCNLHNMDSPDVARLHGSDLKDTWFEFWLNQRYDTVRLRGRSISCTVNPDHHLLHAAAAYYTSPFESAATLAIDPTGCRAFLGRGNRLYETPRGYDTWFNANVGYAHVADELFGSSIIGAGKVMGLAPYGRTEHADSLAWREVADFTELMRLALTDPVYVEVGSRQLNASLAYFVQLGLQRQLGAVLTDLAGVCRRNGIGLDLCLSGGTALNAIANQKCVEESDFARLHLHPACGDDGTAIGAALWYWHHVLGNPRRTWTDAELMYSPRGCSESEIDTAIASAMAANSGILTIERPADYLHRAAELLASGATVGWFDGASEIGPRALGHRSLLADPRNPDMAHHLNSRVKFREPFRPFAPSVLNEHSAPWFGFADSPFMLRACPVLRPGVPAVTHVDGTSRVQTVTAESNPAFYGLIGRFHALTGVPMVLNTSLNTKGLPIDETPADALGTLVSCELDYLVFPGVIVGTRRTT